MSSYGWLCEDSMSCGAMGKAVTQSITLIRGLHVEVPLVVTVLVVPCFLGHVVVISGVSAHFLVLLSVLAHVLVDSNVLILVVPSISGHVLVVLSVLRHLKDGHVVATWTAVLCQSNMCSSEDFPLVRACHVLFQ
jgi:hypothetical protein